MGPSVKKGISWQDRERLGNPKAFFMTIVEALINPFDYYEKLELRDLYLEPLVLCLLNSLFLASPSISQNYYWPSFLAVVFILLETTVMVFVLAFMAMKILKMLGEETSYKKNFYVFCFSTPAFVFACVPQIGFWLAALFVVALVSIGQLQVQKVSIIKIVPTLIFVPALVLGPFSTVSYIQNWQTQHPVVDIQEQAQKVLAVISVASENYATSHGGNYPDNSAVLIAPPKPYLVRDYCGTTINSYQISCDFRNFGYLLKAQPQGFAGRGKKTYYVTTGGKLRAQ